MKYYVTSDVHGFYTLLYRELETAGFFEDKELHKLIILGDLFDRGVEAVQLQEFILELMSRDKVILIRGNHEDLFEELVTIDNGVPYNHHVRNGTYHTALQLTGLELEEAIVSNRRFAEAASNTDFFRQIMPAMRDYYETDNYVFVHGWIPAIRAKRGYSYISDWRNSSQSAWSAARWYNGMDACRTCAEDKIIVCGHWHASYGHSKYESKGSEFGPDADFSPFYGNRMIAVDACTAHSGKINILVLED